jgi:beta-glucanase (GH16 family)
MVYLFHSPLLLQLVASLLPLAAGSCAPNSPSPAPPSTGISTSTAPNAEARAFATYTELAWSDEFSGGTLDPAKWSYEVRDTWYNNELQATTNRPANVAVAGGNLHLTALQESYHGRSYSSGRIITKGKQAFTYGRLDVRAKLPQGKGIWPAIWMLGANDSQVSWPACGEIDIMELRGSAPTVNNSTVHYGTSPADHQYKGTQYTLPSGNFASDFHVFSCVRSLNKLAFFVDGQPYYTVTPSTISPATFPFNAPFYTILNLAVGGDFDGNPDATTTFPQTMLVDYVKFFQYKQ